MTHKSKHNNAGFTKWLEILADEDFPLRANLIFITSGEEDDDKKPRSREKIAQYSEGNGINTATTNMYRGSDKILYNYSGNETDEEGEHLLPTLQKAMRRGSVLSLQSKLSSSMQR